MKITKRMLEIAENKHFNSETHSSLQKYHAMAYVYAKQHHNKAQMNAYRKVAPKKLIEKYSSNKPIRKRRHIRRQENWSLSSL